MSTNAKESPFPTSSDELIFPSASQDISHTLNFLRRTALSSQNRLRSILHDSQFVQNVASTYQLPLVANERCGSWYIPPAVKKGSVYFKSTDGHTGQWAFSLRRLNLHLLDIVDEHGGYALMVSSWEKGTLADVGGYPQMYSCGLDKKRKGYAGCSVEDHAYLVCSHQPAAFWRSKHLSASGRYRSIRECADHGKSCRMGQKYRGERIHVYGEAVVQLTLLGTPA